MVSLVILKELRRDIFREPFHFNNVSYNNGILQHAHINLLFCFLLGLVASDIWFSFVHTDMYCSEV